ncbi:MAG: cell division protein ZapB [Thermodesulfobacteriota bacterium]
MENQEALVRLEQFVDRLLAACRELKEERAALVRRLEDKERLIAEQGEALAALRDERNVVHSRVSGLLRRMEDWEHSELGDEMAGEAEEVAAVAVPRPSSTEPSRLFSLAEER